MSRPICAIFAVVFGVIFSACVDAPAPRTASAAEVQPSTGPCGDYARPCVLEGIEVRVKQTRTASAELPADDGRS